MTDWLESVRFARHFGQQNLETLLVPFTFTKGVH